MSFLYHLISLTFFIGLFSACSVKALTPLENIRNIESLTNLLVELNEKVDRREAHHLAEESIFYSQKLVKEYDLVSPPYVQNTLVNFGLKKRGLCYEWAEDLYAHLLVTKYRTLSLHRVGANIGKLNEHNALSVSFRGKGILNNILLDAWRYSGNLFFIKIEEDKKYLWKERFYK